MSSKKRHCIVESRKSCQSLNSNGVLCNYEDNDKPKIVYVHEPPRKRRTRQDSRNPPTSITGRRRRKSCMNRFCTGICNFFTCSKGTKSAEKCGKRSDESERKSVSSISTRSCENGQYIIYLPGISRSKLQRDYIEPIQKGRFEPIILRTCSRRSICRQCSTCLSCHEKPHDYKIPSKESVVVRCPTRRPRNGKLDEFQMDERLSSAFGDSGDTSNKLARVESEAMSKTLLLYIPLKSGTDLSRVCFPIHEKTFSWEAVQSRHDAACRNKQRIMEELKGKFHTYFETWTRRRLIADMKKTLNNEKKSCTCPPPNMLESRFHHIHWLGNSRSHNMVGRYFDKEENSVVALKIFGERPLDSTLENLDNKLMAIQEIQSLTRLEHRNIVKLLGYFELHDKYHLILESCDHSLRDEIEEAPSGLGASPSKKVIKYILNGLQFCHQAKYLHRDLSPENILVCKSGLVKICDFDRSVFITGKGVGRTSPTPGTFVYNSPEVLAGDKEYGLPSDVWSLGIIFCELLSGKPPWEGTSAQAQLKEIHNSVGPLLPRHASVAKLKVDESNFRIHNITNHARLQQMFTTVSAPCSSFIMKCLDVNPLCRFTCGELLQHSFMKGHHKNE